MKNKITLIMGILLLLSACSEQDYKYMYTEQENVFDILNNKPHTSAERDYKTIQNGQNPMKRPSYDEYREK